MLQDSFGRKLQYLRLSITDVCNFKCSYCLPDGYRCEERKQYLSVAEIERLVKAFAVAGTKKIRITGGEPSLRKDLTEIIAISKQVDGVKKVALTTNGYRMDRHINSWASAGLDALNVSVDSLVPSTFKLITGHDHLTQLMTGIDRALSLGISKVKINTVLMRKLNAGQLNQYLDWIKHTPVTLRFIELMRTGDNGAFFKQQHIPSSGITEMLDNGGWIPVIPENDAGPAVEYAHPEYSGKIGVIAPYSKTFCTNCNRLRVSSEGKLHLCLFGGEDFNLRPLLQSDSQQKELAELLREQVSVKQESHHLLAGNSGSTRHLAELGG